LSLSKRLQSALERGVTQVVLLGAGLDAFALRKPEVPRRTLFVEVDHPASQRWKLGRLEALGLQTPSVKYLPVDFASQNLENELTSVGVRVGIPTFSHGLESRSTFLRKTA
jgi:methyltransferase (TIGR00027 family)